MADDHYADIKLMKPAEALRLAADLMDLVHAEKNQALAIGKLYMVHAIARHISSETGAVLALVHMLKTGGQHG